MKKLKMKPARWLKAPKFPLQKDTDYLQTLNFFERGIKSFLVPKGLALTVSDVGSFPYSHVYESVQEQVKGTLHSFGLGYREEASGAVQGSSKIVSYTKFFTGNSYASAVAGVDYKLFTARFEFDFLIAHPQKLIGCSPVKFSLTPCNQFLIAQVRLKPKFIWHCHLGT